MTYVQPKYRCNFSTSESFVFGLIGCKKQRGSLTDTCICSSRRTRVTSVSSGLRGALMKRQQTSFEWGFRPSRSNLCGAKVQAKIDARPGCWGQRAGQMTTWHRGFRGAVGIRGGRWRCGFDRPKRGCGPNTPRAATRRIGLPFLNPGIGSDQDRNHIGFEIRLKLPCELWSLRLFG